MKSVFISSTFKDMQAERDLLHERIFPRLRRVMAEYGEDIQELDLRWGVDTANMTEEESGHAVLKVCIDAIDRCKPFFVVLLGERYGWIPGSEIVTSVGDDRISGYYEPEMSITNLEISYGALAREEHLERCVFCFRDPSFHERIDPKYRGIYDAESAHHREKLTALKDTILDRGKGEILRYTADWDPDAHRVCGLDTFGEEVYRILEAMIRKEFAGQKAAGEEEQLLRQMAQTKERYLSSYIPRPAEELAILERCVSFGMASEQVIEATRLGNVVKKEHSRSESSAMQREAFGRVYADRKRVFVQGEAGTGKSALMAACAGMLEGGRDAAENRGGEGGRDAAENRGGGEGCAWHTILYFAGSPGCQDPAVLKRVLIWRLEEILGEPHENHGESPEERLNTLDERITAEQRIFCFLDGADQLFPEGEDVYLDVLKLCPHLFFVISALPSFPFTEAVTGTGVLFDTAEIRGLGKGQIRQMIAATAGRRGKKLDDVVSRAVAEKKGSGNPLYLSMVLQRFFMMDGAEFAAAEALAPGMEGLHRYMMELLKKMPEDAEGMARYLLAETAGHFGSDEFTNIVSLIAASREGLSEQELEGILKEMEIPFSPVRFQQIVSYLYDTFAQRQDGKWSFSHRLFQEAVLLGRTAFVHREEEEPPRDTPADAAAALRVAEDLLITYAQKDREFLKREGYYYLLAGRCPEGAQIPEEAGRPGGQEGFYGKEDFRGQEGSDGAACCTADELYRVIPLLLHSGQTYRPYFVRMVKTCEAPDALAAFWSRKFFVASSRPEYETQHEIWDALLEHPACSAAAKLACCKQYALSCRTERDFAGEKRYLDRAARLIEELPKEVLAYEQAQHLADRGDHAKMTGDLIQAVTLYRRALTLVERIEPHRSASEPASASESHRSVSEPASASESHRSVSEPASASGQAEKGKLLRIRLLRGLYENGGQTEDGAAGEALLLRALEESGDCDCRTPSSAFTGEKIQLLGQLTRLYVTEEHFDIGKAKRYGEEGIALARACVQMSPTVQYLYLLAQMLTNAAALKKGEYQYPYYREALDCRKRIFGSLATADQQLELACTYTWYAQSLDEAVDAGVKNLPENAKKQAAGSWEEGFALLEEMLPGAAGEAAAINYRGRLYAKAKNALGRREYEEAIHCAERMMELLSDDGAVRQDEAVMQGETVAQNETVTQGKAVMRDAARSDGGYEKLQMENKAGQILTEAYTAMLREDEILSRARETAEQGRMLKAQKPSAHTEDAFLKSELLLARALYRQGAFTEASAACREAEESCQRLVAQGYGYLAAREELSYMQGRICYEQGDYGRASAYWKTAKEVKDKRKQWNNSSDMLLDYGIGLLEADLASAEGKYGYGKALSLYPDPTIDTTFSPYSPKTIHRYNRGSGEEYDCARLDVCEGYGLMRRGDTLRISGRTQAWESGVDVVNGILAFAEPESGGEREYGAAYLRCRKWMERFPRIRRLAMRAFEQMREMCSLASEERRIFLAAALSCGITNEGRTLYAWERDFFCELLMEHDMSAIGNADFWKGMARCMRLLASEPGQEEKSIVSRVHRENRAGIGEAYFLEGNFERALLWLAQAPEFCERMEQSGARQCGERMEQSPAQQCDEPMAGAENDALWIWYLTLGELELPGCQDCEPVRKLPGHQRQNADLQLHETAAYAVDRRHLEAILKALPEGWGSVRAVCQRSACHELLAAMTEGEEQAGHIRAVFMAKHPFTEQYRDRQILRILRRHASAMEWMDDGQEESLQMAEDLTAAAEHGTEYGYFADAKEEILTLILAGRVCAGQGCNQMLWERLSGDGTLWEQCRDMTDVQDLCRLISWWAEKRDEEPADQMPGEERFRNGWSFRKRLALELYERTGESFRITDLADEVCRYLAKKNKVGRYRLPAAEQSASARQSEWLARDLWELLRDQITGTAQADTDKGSGGAGDAATDTAAFWAEAAMKKLREGTLADRMTEDHFLEAGSFLGEEYPQYREQIREIWQNRDQRKLDGLLAGLHAIFDKKFSPRHSQNRA